MSKLSQESQALELEEFDDLPGIFLEKLLGHGDKIAISDGVNQLSYVALVAECNLVYKMLSQVDYLDTSKDCIGIELGRGTTVIVFAVTCFLYKIPFILINPEWPTLRKEQLLSLTGASVRITNDLNSAPSFVGNTVKFNLNKIALRKDTSTTSLQAKIAYFATSSGTTGDVKCAKIAAESLYLLMKHQSQQFFPKEELLVLQTSNPGFDAIISEIFVSLWGGCHLRVVATQDKMLIPSVITILERETVDVITLTPSVAQKIPFNLLQKLKTLILVGEVATCQLLKPLLGHVRILNAYGPCEATVCSHIHEIKNLDEIACIGRPFSYIKARIVDEHGCDVSDGMVGELWLYGPAVGLGYTTSDAERFVINSQYGRCFKTGDMVQRDSENVYTFSGRNDAQIKIRGQKVNLNELMLIAKKVNNLSNVAVLTPGKDSSQFILAYEGRISEDNLRQYLIEKLPKASVPATIIQVVSMPFNLSGKIDIDALKLLFNDEKTRRKSEHGEQSEFERIARTIFQRILERDIIDPDSDFFDAGGDSLKVIDLITEFETATNRKMDINAFFEKPTLRNFISFFKDVSTQFNDSHHVIFQDQMEYLSRMEPISKGGQDQNANLIILTGASGRIGRVMVNEFLRSTSSEILCIGRQSPENFIKDESEKSRVSWLQCDFTSKSSMDNLHDLVQKKVKKPAYLIHAAARVNHVFDFEALYQENVTATFNLLKLSHELNIKRFFYLSSTSAITPFQENNYFCTGYDLTKGACESLINSALNSGLKATILKLPLVYDITVSARDMIHNDHFIARTSQCVAMSCAPQVNDLIPSISAQDLAKIICKMLSNPNALDDTYTTLYDDGMRWTELLSKLDKQNLMHYLPYSEWVDNFLINSSETDALLPFASLYSKGGALNQQASPATSIDTCSVEKFRKYLHSESLLCQSSSEILESIFC